MEDVKKCSVCKDIKPLSEFNSRPDRPSGYRSECKKCQYKRQSLRERYISPIKSRARNTLRYAVKQKKIIKPKRCEICKEIKPLDGHHDDYSKPLDVKWLCSKCHSKVYWQKIKTRLEKE